MSDTALSQGVASVHARDHRFELPTGAGTDSIHSEPVYSFAVAELTLSSGGPRGVGLALTLGRGNDVVCQLIDEYGSALIGRDFGELFANFGETSRRLADDPQLRWLGPHKGAVHLALASITNAVFDLWAKLQDKPLWAALLDLEPRQLVDMLDLSYLEDVLTGDDAVTMLEDLWPSRSERAAVIASGYPGYDTSAGWIQYDDASLRDHVRRALDEGFEAIKLKVGSPDFERDLRRATIIRELIGDDKIMMFDANQAWSVPDAITRSQVLSVLGPKWIEEPTHPDDLLGHARIAREIAPTAVATGEHLANRVDFKNYIEAGAMGYVQADCTRLGGVSEFITVSLLARKAGLPVMPHVGDMGQIHQHLVLFNHIALGHDVLFLEHIPHLRPHFVHPAKIEGGHYRVPNEPGSSSDLVGS